MIFDGDINILVSKKSFALSGVAPSCTMSQQLKVFEKYPDMNRVRLI